MKLAILDQKAKDTSKKVDLEPTIFEAKINDDLETQALKIYSYNQRHWNAKAKGRSEVRGGGKKPFAQKGTGNARAGTIRSPLWVGGGTVFGPVPKVKKLKMAKKMRKGSIRSALSRKAKSEMIRVLDNLDLTGEKLTKQMMALKDALTPKELEHTKVKVAFVVHEKNELLSKSAKNLDDVKVLLPEAINIRNLTESTIVVFTEDSLNEITKVWKVRK